MALKLLSTSGEHASSLLPQPREFDLVPQAVANIILIRCVKCQSGLSKGVNTPTNLDPIIMLPRHVESLFGQISLLRLLIAHVLKAIDQYFGWSK